MIKVFIGMPGSGKTYRLKSSIFHPNFVHTLKPSSDLSFLLDKTNCHIYVDCECDTDEFLKTISLLIKRARMNQNDITITMLELWDNLSDYEHSILINANQILVGRCCIFTDERIEYLYQTKLRPLESKYDFRCL